MIDQAYLNLRILPCHFQGNDSNFLSNHFFCWRWFKRDGQDFKVVTLENTEPDNNLSYINMQIYPLNLAGKNDYQSELTNKTRFFWKVYDREGETFKVVILQETVFAQDIGTRGVITPIQLAGTNGYSKDLDEDHRFCWRWLHAQDGTQYKALTIE